MSVARVLSGHPLAVAVGLGVVGSVAGVMLVEFLALSRLLHVVTARPSRSIRASCRFVMVAAGPVSRATGSVSTPLCSKRSLIALWLSRGSSSRSIRGSPHGTAGTWSPTWRSGS